LTEWIRQLTSFTDFAFRLLIYAAARNGRLVTIEHVVGHLAISRGHLMKVARTLTNAGYLTPVRGRGGGLRLARPPREIRFGNVVRATEPDFALVECFESDNHCVITPKCRLRTILHESLDTFIAVLEQYTLSDLMLRLQDFGFQPAA
jgi:Rrf2 family nitric oxide-sensitive transcriptional repressor